ncbi:hypothetical protein PRUPE_7G079500 [Prunus persica]|uniref:Uncharacterized protein n=1 Tax=Prunus persica TaxID=3760 RepID=A0A251N8C9_PRUPE|nr:hypothetical protein PRUPE_7G079500 [Prunus persica]
MKTLCTLKLKRDEASYVLFFGRIGGQSPKRPHIYFSSSLSHPNEIIKRCRQNICLNHHWPHLIYNKNTDCDFLLKMKQNLKRGKEKMPQTQRVRK